MSSIPTSSTMYNTETPPEIAPENPPESFTADGDTTNNETVSMLALHRCAHTPALSALGMPSISRYSHWHEGFTSSILSAQVDL
jgi:hypothetical protein